MFSVRGIGVAVMRQHVDLLAHLLDALLVRHAEALLLVDDEQAEIAKLHVLRQQPVRADDDVDLAAGELLERSPSDLLLRAEAADHVDRAPGTPRTASVSVSKCWNASTVVGARTATCLPSITALKAARIATSVLP